jgi:hypothetical protein
MQHINRLHVLTALLGILVWMSACNKDDYYRDSGTHDPNFKGSTMDYLDAVPFHFDSVAAIVRLAGMEEVFREDTLTFFSPTDRCIGRLVKQLNRDLYALGHDTIVDLDDVPTAIWSQYLQTYMFRGANQLKDFPQIDYDLRSIYPGQGYLSWNRTPMNIGVIYNDDNGVKYVGYRQLSIAYIPNPAKPLDNWFRTDVASSNILTYNGAVHVLRDDHLFFGWDYGKFFADMQVIMDTDD